MNCSRKLSKYIGTSQVVEGTMFVIREGTEMVWAQVHNDKGLLGFTGT